jgi:hypothetical protein
VKFKTRPVSTEVRNDWIVAKEYANEGPGPWLVDLGHKTRWDLQDGHLDDWTPGGVTVPAVPGECRLANRILVNRMNRTQAAIWHLGNGDGPELPAEKGYTDVSEATVFLALFGKDVFSIAERLTSLDFLDPNRQPPFLVQGPFSRVPCQIVTLAREADGTGGLLLTCSRGYSGDMVDAILAAGAAYGLSPAGEDRFNTWVESIRCSTNP